MQFFYTPHRIRHILRPISRYASNFNRPSPPSLPLEQQREFEELQRVSQKPLAARTPSNNRPTPEAEVDLALHPDARQPLKPEFEGDVHPITGEHGGPKREPVGRWGHDSEGDWSFKGRVSDF